MDSIGFGRKTSTSPCRVGMSRLLSDLKPLPTSAVWVIATCGCMATPAMADDASLAFASLTTATTATAAKPPRPRIEIAAASLLTAPMSRSDNAYEPARNASRDRAAGDLANATTRLEVSGWSHAPQQSAMALALGVDTPSGPWVDSRGGAAVDVGLRWRSAPLHLRRIDVVAFRRVSQPQDAYTLINSADQPIYAARVEMQFQSAKFGGLTPELGAIGMQLTGGSKVVLRTKRGGPMVYYRSRF
ncbi:MAG: hypothetical protein JWP29_4729 [Rhodoferax sp.]|nr:hypothetical protein [Rhodoferax sp.]